MNHPDSRTSEPPTRIIVLERRSLFSQFGGLWFVAVPLLVAYLISTLPRELAEPAVASLNLPSPTWINDPKPLANVATTTKAAEPKPEKPAPVVTKTIVSEKPPAKPAEVAKESEPAQPPQELPNGVVVLNAPNMAANPVAVFDPAQSAAKQADEAARDARKPEPAPPIADTGDETKKVLAEINAAAESAKSKKERDQALMPLIAEHERIQSEKRKKEAIENLRRRAETGREPFFEGLTEILGGPGNVIAKGEKIDLYMRRESEGFNISLFQPVFTKIETAKRPPSTARKIDFLRSEGVPEPIILAYLIQLDIKQIRKPEGPRDSNDAIVRSAKLLLRNRD